MGQIYVSYSQNHKDAARKIRDALEAWGHTVWMDDPDEMFDQLLAEQLELGLRNAQIVIALLSAASVKSRTVRREIAIAKSMHKYIIPVLVEPMPNVEQDKVIDATRDLQSAISRLVKVVDARAASLPTEPPLAAPEEDIEDDEDEPEGSVNRLVILGGLAIIVIIVVLAIIALSQQSPAPVNDNQPAAGAQQTLDAQATTIAQLQTQAALDNAIIVSDTPTVITPTVTPQLSIGPTDEPSPTPEILGPVMDATDTPIPIIITPVVPSDGGGADVPAQNFANPGFETFVTYDVLEQVAQGWTPFAIAGEASYDSPPVYGATAPEDGRIVEGLNGQRLTAQFTAFDGGLYQRVTGLTSGKAVHFSLQAYVWSSSFENRNLSEDDGDVTVQIGIDPTGGTDAQSMAVIWSDPLEMYDSFNEYGVSTTSAGDAVTVFIRATVLFPVQNSIVYLDDARLTIAP